MEEQNLDQIVEQRMGSYLFQFAKKNGFIVKETEQNNVNVEGVKALLPDDEKQLELLINLSNNRYQRRIANIASFFMWLTIICLIISFVFRVMLALL